MPVVKKRRTIYSQHRLEQKESLLSGLIGEINVVRPADESDSKIASLAKDSDTRGLIDLHKWGLHSSALATRTSKQRNDQHDGMSRLFSDIGKLLVLGRKPFVTHTGEIHLSDHN